MPLGDGGRIIFDGSAETDGSFVFFGSEPGDTFLGGAGDDRICRPRRRRHAAPAAAAATRSSIPAPANPSGADYDTLADFNPGVDHDRSAGRR